jgi:WD40 repeat protein
METIVIAFVVLLLGYLGYAYLSNERHREKRPNSILEAKLRTKDTSVSKKLPGKLNVKMPAQEHHEPPKKSNMPEHALLAHVLKGHTASVTSASFSPNGRYIVTASMDRTV